MNFLFLAGNVSFNNTCTHGHVLSVLGQCPDFIRKTVTVKCAHSYMVCMVLLSLSEVIRASLIHTTCPATEKAKNIAGSKWTWEDRVGSEPLVFVYLILHQSEPCAHFHCWFISSTLLSSFDCRSCCTGQTCLLKKKRSSHTHVDFFTWVTQ